MRRVAAILLLFDIDGTLLLSGGAGLAALNRAFEELFGTADAFCGISVAGRTDPGLLDDALTRAGMQATSGQRRQFYDRYCEILEMEIVRSRPRKRLMPGVTGLLTKLRSRADLRTGLLTGNVARAAQIKLEHFDLSHFFAMGAYGDDASHRDELVPVAIDRARAAGIHVDSPAEVVVIGDTPLDVRCARAWGAGSVGVATGSFGVDTLERCGAGAVLPDLSDVGAFLDAIRSARSGVAAPLGRGMEADEDRFEARTR